MAGLSLPVKLRRGLGKGRVVPAEELARRLAPYDEDKDGSMTREELVRFLAAHHVGGPWFCEVLGKTLWRIAEERWLSAVTSIRVGALANIIHFAMSYPASPDRRYVITGDVMMGLEAKRPIGAPPPKKKGPPAARPPHGDSTDLSSAAKGAGSRGAGSKGPGSKGKKGPVPRAPGPKAPGPRKGPGGAPGPRKRPTRPGPSGRPPK